MKRIYKSALIVFTIAAITVAGTSAYFSSRKTIEGNTFTSGTIDLSLNGQQDHESLSLENFKPGEVRKISYFLKNEGTLDGQPSITFGSVTNDDNGCTEPEDILDNSCSEVENGELGAHLQIKAEWRQGTSAFQNIKLKNKSGTANLNIVKDVTAGLGLMNTGGIDHALPILSSQEGTELRFTFTLPMNTSNIVQTDSSEVDLTFNLAQPQ